MRARARKVPGRGTSQADRLERLVRLEAFRDAWTVKMLECARRVDGARAKIERLRKRLRAELSGLVPVSAAEVVRCEEHVTFDEGCSECENVRASIDSHGIKPPALLGCDATPPLEAVRPLCECGHVFESHKRRRGGSPGSRGSCSERTPKGFCGVCECSSYRAADASVRS